MAFQQTIEVATHRRGTQDITELVNDVVRASNVATGLAHVFVLHTSCSVIITENASSAVRQDLESLARRWAPDGDSAYVHCDEGDDDMAAHGRSIVAGTSITVPIRNANLLLGTWQGIYLWEHRTHAHRRRIAVTIVS